MHFCPENPANKFAGYICEVHLRGLESAQADLASVARGFNRRVDTVVILERSQIELWVHYQNVEYRSAVAETATAIGNYRRPSG